MPNFSLSADSWDLHRRADRDRARHNEKVKEVIRQNLGDIVSHQDIITADKGKIVKIPVRSLELPRIRFDNRKSTRLNSSHGYISYAVFCLKKKKHKPLDRWPEAMNSTTGDMQTQ